jgi:ABC-type phosphate/phosphonate transport system substrate-binding protein
VEDVERGFNYELEKFSTDKSYIYKLRVFSGNQQLTNLLLEHKIHGYFGSPFLLTQHMKEFNTSTLYSPEFKGKVTQRYVVLVRKDSAIDELAKLKHTSLSYCGADEVGIMWLKKTLRDKKNEDVNSFFTKISIKKNPNLAILAVFFKDTEAVLMLEDDFKVAAELNPQLSEQLRIIQTSPEYIVNVLAVTNHIEGILSTDEYERNVLALGNVIQGNKLLKTYNFGTLRKISTEELNSVRDLIATPVEKKGITKP